MRENVTAGDDRPIRFRCDFEAQLDWSGGAHPVRVLDLSETGAFIETELQVQSGDRGVLRIALSEGESVALPVRITRLATAQREIRDRRAQVLTVARLGAAVAFDPAPAAWSVRLRALLSELAER